ncbi:MAG: dephospho-CoA kinase [Cyclobacteriaceae bacterium]
MQNNFFSVGITGGIGSGKSLISNIFSVFGVPVYDADTRGKWLLTHDEKLKQEVISYFGEESFDAQGQPNRSYLAQTIFNDEAKRQQLNQLVHPRVGQDYQRWREEHAAYAYTLKEAALLFESGSYQQLDCIINVNADAEVRIRRVLLRDPQRSRQQVEAIMQKQWTDEERARNADYTLVNDERKLLTPQLIQLHQKLLQASAKT